MAEIAKMRSSDELRDRVHRERRDRGERYVDSARRQDHEHAEREQADDDAGPRDVEQARRLEEVRVDETDDAAEANEKEEREELGPAIETMAQPLLP
jgi:hypothetical protein